MIVSVDFQEDQIAFLEKLQAMGAYPSRSEAVRDMVRRMQFVWAWKKGIAMAKQDGVTPDIEAEREAAFAVLGKRFQ